MHKKLLVYLLIALCMLIVFAILRSNVVGRIQLKNLEGCARDCGVLKPQVEFNAGLNSEEGRRIRQKYDSAWNLFVAPTSESKFLGRRLTPVRDYFPTEKISSKDVAAIDRWIESNRAFIESYGDFKALGKIAMVGDISNPDFDRIISCNARTLLISKLYAMKIEQDILLNSPTAAYSDILTLSKTDDIAINNPFKIAGDLVGMINVNLCTAINRAVNSLNFSKEELQGILSLLEEREGKIATVYNNLLTGIITDFNLQLDSGKRFLTGHDLFWIEAGRYKAEAIHSPKKSAIDDTTEKLNMLKAILSMKTLLNKRTYDEASRGILAEIRLSEKEYANSFYADYIDFEQLYYSFLRDLATVRMQATLIAAVMEWRKTGSVPTAVSTLSEAEKIPVQMTINPFSGKPFQIASESIGDSGAGAKKAIVIQGIKEWKEFHGAIKAIYVMGNE